MKIRKKITLWISGAALLSTIIFSSIIFWELTEEPFKLIDKEIEHMATTLADRLRDAGSFVEDLNLNGMPYDPDHYWIMVKADQEQMLYQSKLTEFTDLSAPNKESKYLIEKHIPKSKIWLQQDSKDDVLFRVMVVREQIRGRSIEIRIAKPIEDLEEELIELAIDIGISLCLCALGIFILSYVLAGRILRPISAIIHQSREISEKSLDKRIPLGKTRDELYELSVALNKMFDRIQHSFNRQKEFIGNASHELKSPVTLLMLSQEDMLMNEALSPSAEESLMKQLDTSRRMSHLVKNLLDLSRMEQQDILHMVRLDLAVTIERVLDDYADVLTEKQILVQNQVNFPCPIMGDPEKLFRLFVNLIDNAIRYNLPAEGTIRIRVERLKTEVCIEILNSGFKIPEQDISRLFEQFYRVEKSRSQSLGGSGLGLAIAQKIVKLHNGRINITNGPNQMIQTIVCLPENS
ncbi:sensor histidine kinase [Desulfobacter hydrogenophilus]|uniref:histidine kinase n=1 Tax=Desulfobacter hydrogenophilus TaxID=2291 RepID=A0A328FDN2_9BACT|nr:ATP-binding protein [Desulfobacter hydrogenophilus]NDY72846.1 HAMP domain-containing protein [Desulfobacter hydrogenophilus]QBH13620.1 HAMP domain-containing protein [Desulfobacter hydrogenophilus]RAM01155.1 sensor histidine kinase [Desulfobacter hydrogenophilus]